MIINADIQTNTGIGSAIHWLFSNGFQKAGINLSRMPGLMKLNTVCEHQNKFSVDGSYYLPQAKLKRKFGGKF